MYQLTQRTVATDDFPALFAESIAPDEQNRLMYAHLSTSPGSLLEEAIVYTYGRTGSDEGPVPALRDEQGSGVGRLVLNVARHGGLGQRLKWAAQKHVLPRVRPCDEPRNEALRAAEACLVSRNQAMYNGLGLLRNRLTRYTDVLQEYFLPHDRLVPFINEARAHLKEHDAVLMNASIRVVHDDDVMLSYASGERFSLVLYLSQEVTHEGNRDMADLTRELVEAALRHEGTFYLPYQQHYTREDLERAYPRIDEFFALKRRYDPQRLFMNRFYSRYAQA
jgi:FAD/FMN-containing dehydrogenase